MNIRKTPTTVLEETLRKLQNKFKAVDKLAEDGKIPAETAVRACQRYLQEINKIKDEIGRRPLTHNPFKVLEEELR